MKQSPQRLLICCLLGITIILSLSATALAQSGTGEVRGTVKDLERGDPLIGANVVFDGTNFGAAANIEGVYSIKGVPAGRYTLVVRYVGYRQQSKEITVTANTTTTVDFSLSVSALQMDEVVVTGQGSAIERRKLATPIETISAKEVSSAPVTSLDQLLQGRVPGMVSFTSSGQPGTAGRIRTRGIRSAFASQTPVIFVDGVRVDNQDNFRLQRGTGGQVTSSLADIVVGQIERVEVIKGGAAATLFGSDAASGVIQVFTKKGFAGAPRWTLSTSLGVDQPETRWILEQFTKDKVLKNGNYQQYTANVTGGSDVSSYNVTGRMQSSDGTILKNNSRFYNMGGGMRSQMGDRLTVEFSAGYTNSFFGGMFNNNAIASILGSTEDSTIQSTPNPDSTLRIALLPEHKEVVNRVTTSATARYNPYNFLGARFTVGIDYRKNEQRIFNPIAAATWTSTPGGQLARFDRDFLTISLDAATTLSYPNGKDFSSTLTIGVQGFREEDRQSQATGSNFPVPGTDDYDNAATVTAAESNQQLFSGGFYLNENFGIFDKIFLDLGIRVDGNSAFGKDAGVQTYPKAGIAYNIADEEFWPLKEYWNSLKLRASYGVTGKFPQAFTRDRTFNAGRFQNIGFVTFANPGDKNLKPEKTTTIEFGFDAGFLEDRIALQATYFTETTRDALFNVAEQVTSGFGNQLRNVGEIENKGLEISLNAVPISTPDIEWSIRFSYSNLKNKVTSLGGTPPFNIGGFAFLPQRIEEGQPIGVFRLNIPRPDLGPGQYDVNVVDHGKSATPEHTGSISTNLTLLRDIQINMIADYSYGAYALNTGAVIRYFNGMYPEVTWVPTGYNFSTASAVWLEKVDWLKVREISARYKLPVGLYENWGIRSVGLTFSIRNVFAITPVSRFDPELHGVRAGRQLDIGGINFFTLSAPREYRFGLDLTL